MLAQVARGGHAYRLYDRCQDAQPGDGLVDELEVEPAVTEDASLPWLITPHEGVSDLNFAMDRDVVEAIMGAPASVRITRTGRMRLEYGQASPALVFVDDSLVEINFLPEVSGGLVLDGLCWHQLSTTSSARFGSATMPQARDSALSSSRDSESLFPVSNLRKKIRER
jgi:hypothetical protein